MNRTGLGAALAAAILPDATDTLLLRACLQEAGPARAAWNDWSARVGNPKSMLEAETRGLKGMLPMIDGAFRRHGLPGPDGMGIYLKAATLREDLRTRLITGFVSGVLDEFEQDGIAFTMLGGIVAAHTVYDRPTLRHCHAVDIMVAPADRSRAPAALGRAGFLPLAGSATEFRHTDGLALHLWPDIAFHPYHRAPDGGVARRALPFGLGGRTVPGASSTDRLIMALSRAASTPERGNLRWACDAFLTAPSVDWPLFLGEIERRRMGPAAALLCRHQAEALDAPIPNDVLDRLDRLAAEASPLDREAALSGALTGLSAAKRALAAPGIDGPARRAIIRYLALPSDQCMEWTYGPANGPRRVLQRLHRPIRYAVDRIRRRIAG
ncbi:MAG: nucleotidyltransferase family protein [Sphingomonadales bacterium]